MSFWQKVQQIATKIKEKGTASIRKIAEATGLSKSSVHRHLKAKERRNQYPESHLWETAEGQQWLSRLVVSSLFHFGFKRGVGAESITAFLEDLRIQTHVGISATALRGVQKRLEKKIIEYGQVHQAQGVEAGGAQEIVGGVDETFFEQMVLVMLDLPSGYLIMEEFSGRRSFKSWQEKAEQALQSLTVQVRYLVSDRAKALIKLAVAHFGCRSIADLFHALHEIAKGFSFSIQTRLNQAQKKLEKADEALGALTPQSEPWQQQNEQRQQLAQEVEKWQKVQEQYQGLMQQFSLSVHPFAVGDNAPQSAASVEQHLKKTVAQLEALVQLNGKLGGWQKIHSISTQKWLHSR
jgi:AcrR family transcriptional regulator